MDPTLDIVFRMLLTRRPELLRDMLEGVLGRPIRSLTVIDADIPGELVGDKQIILDIRVELEDGTHVDVEMQVRASEVLVPRVVYYVARDFSDQLGRGDDYRRLRPSIVVVWVVEPLFPDLDRLHSVFELRERHTHRAFGDHLAIHLLQLSCLPMIPATGYAARVERWARFLVADDAELERLAAEDPVMSIAKQTLEELSDDPQAQRLARRRADMRTFYRMEQAALEEKAEARGEARGEAKMLLRQLELRFGPVPEAVRVRVGAAEPPQLEAWAERVLTATTLDEVVGS